MTGECSAGAARRTVYIGRMMTSLAFLLFASQTARAECAAVDLDATLKATGAAMEIEGNRGAVGVVATAWHALPGSCEPVPPTAIAALATKAGALLLQSETRADADAWFDRVATLAPNVATPAGLDPDVASHLADAIARRSTRSVVRVVASEVVALDGVLIDPQGTATPTTGEHLVQWQRKGAWTGAWLTLESAEVLDLPGGAPIPVMAMTEARKPTPAGPVALLTGGLVLAGIGAGVVVVASADAETQTSPGATTGLGLVIAGGAAAVAGGVWGVTLLLPAGGGGVAVRGTF